MHDLGRNEDRLRGTYEFPFEFHHIDSTHPRYVMSYHWHVECEIMRILQGTLTVTLDEKNFTAVKNDVIFVISAGNLLSPRPEWSLDHKNNLLVVNGRKDDIVYCPAESIRNLSVGALNPDGDGLASYSCKGKGSTFGIKPDFVHKSGCGLQDKLRGTGCFL